jgi:hypothetical protein
VTSIPESTLEAYFRAWNEPNDAARLRLLETAWADDGVLRDGPTVLTGRDEVNAYMGQAIHGAPGRLLERGAPLAGPGGRRAEAWILRFADGSTRNGYFVGEVDADGRITGIDVYSPSVPDAAAPGIRQRLLRWVATNPLPTGGLVLAALYVMLRLQAERFYSEFNVTPEEAGFGPIDIAVRQSAYVLLVFVAAGVLWSVLYFGAMYPAFAVARTLQLSDRRGEWWKPVLTFALSFTAVMLLAYGANAGRWIVAAVGGAIGVGCLYLPRYLVPDADAARAEAQRGLLRWGAWVALVGTLFVGLGAFALEGWIRAKDDAAAVRDGESVGDNVFPWRAERVAVTWQGGEVEPPLPGCDRLVYLGDNGGRVVLYDQAGKRTVRVDSGDVQLVFPDDC